MLLGHLRADAGDARVDLGAVVAGPGDGRPDRAQQRVGQLERVAPGDVEAVEEAATDEVEVARHRGADLAVDRRAARRAPCSGSPSDSSERAGRRVGLDRGDQPTELAGGARRHRRRAAHHRQRIGRRGRRSRPSRWASRSPTGTIAEAVKRMCWYIICQWWSRHRVEVRDARSSSESASASTACSSRCRAIDVGFATSSHSCSCSRQTLRAQTSSARAKRCGISVVGRRPHRGVREAVDVRRLHAADRRAVERHELRGAADGTARGASRRSTRVTGRGKCTGSRCHDPGRAARTSAELHHRSSCPPPRARHGRDRPSLTVALRGRKRGSAPAAGRRSLLPARRRRPAGSMTGPWPMPNRHRPEERTTHRSTCASRIAPNSSRSTARRCGSGAGVTRPHRRCCCCTARTTTAACSTTSRHASPDSATTRSRSTSAATATAARSTPASRGRCCTSTSRCSSAT